MGHQISTGFIMVSTTVFIASFLVGVCYAAPQFRAAPYPPYNQYSYSGQQGLPYTSPLAATRNLDLPAPPATYRQIPLTPRPVAILRQSQDTNFDGTFSYGFQSEDGTAVQVSGNQVALGADEPGQAASGTYSYIAPDGTPITTNWYADETGFHADGAHLPKGPEGHVRSL
ncbi:larval cuticle protein 1 [Halyomorpha halys]|uniref:larval cuticle protein 1 n=1 Tax=Halyomorpha halys TaxID=286706 RepID=UPI0006D50F51|nr:endocuticle structural glycoprotein SgAbd-2-like [Halyomorpha halys]KAE8573245.1 Cuticle Protein CPR RR-1 [Halyomorpha halys]